MVLHYDSHLNQRMPLDFFSWSVLNIWILTSQKFTWLCSKTKNTEGPGYNPIIDTASRGEEWSNEQITSEFYFYNVQN